MWWITGYDVIQQEKEKGRSNVLRLSHPGCETHFLSTDSVSETQAWYNRIEAACNTPPLSSDTVDSTAAAITATAGGTRVRSLPLFSPLTTPPHGP